jgi:hypothetical protein
MKQTNSPTLKDPSSSAFASAEEISPPPQLQGNGREDEEEASLDEKNISGELQMIFSEETQLRYIEDEMAAGIRERSRVVVASGASGELERIFSEETQLRYIEDEMAAGIRERSRVVVASGASRPGAVAVAGVIRAPTCPSVTSQPERVPSVTSQPSLIVAELAEPYQEDEELRRQYQNLEEQLRRRNQDLERFEGEDVTSAVVIVEDGGGGDDDQDAASSPFGRKALFLIGADVFALVLVVGVILGVTIPEDATSAPVNPPPAPVDPRPAPTQSPTKAPTAAPTACTTGLDCLAVILLQNEVSDAE